MSMNAVEIEFPNLACTKYQITSPQDKKYNCIASAANDNEKFWWPIGGYWPPNVPRTETLDAFIRAYSTMGYSPCKNGSREMGFEKVAIYADSNNKPKHAARQIGKDMWTSKLGRNIDISHELKGLEGISYGKSVLFLKRPSPGMRKVISKLSFLFGRK